MFMVRKSAIFLSCTYTAKKVWVTELGHRKPVLQTRTLPPAVACRSSRARDCTQTTTVTHATAITMFNQLQHRRTLWKKELSMQEKIQSFTSLKPGRQIYECQRIRYFVIHDPYKTHLCLLWLIIWEGKGRGKKNYKKLRVKMHHGSGSRQILVSQKHFWNHVKINTRSKENN